MTEYKHLFGPVLSRRLGRSLGIELITQNTCSIDCLFCQAGRTTTNTIDRKEYIPTTEVLDELSRWIKEQGQADYITLSGTGEPTLHVDFGKVLQFVKDHSSIPTAIMSNGSLFSLPEVRDAASRSALVKVSLSAWDQESYQQINRPHPDLILQNIVEGYKTFRAQFKGTMWIEVFIMDGINSSIEQVEKIASLADSIGADLIHINTVVRTPAETYAKPVDHDRLAKLMKVFKTPAEIIAPYQD